MIRHETLKLTAQTLQSLRRIIAYYLPDEQKHYEANGEPFDHAYHDLVAVRWAIREHDNEKEQERITDGKLNELAVRLTQG